MLSFNQNLCFLNTGIRTPVYMLGSKKSKEKKNAAERNQLIEQAKQLRADGLTYKQIGERLGKNKSTIWHWLIDSQNTRNE